MLARILCRDNGFYRPAAITKLIERLSAPTIFKLMQLAASLLQDRSYLPHHLYRSRIGISAAFAGSQVLTRNSGQTRWLINHHAFTFWARPARRMTAV